MRSMTLAGIALATIASQALATPPPVTTGKAPARDWHYIDSAKSVCVASAGDRTGMMTSPRALHEALAKMPGLSDEVAISRDNAGIVKSVAITLSSGIKGIDGLVFTFFASKPLCEAALADCKSAELVPDIDAMR